MIRPLKEWWYRRKLDSRDPQTRCRAIRGLAAAGGSAVVPKLLPLLLDSDPPTRQATQQALSVADPRWQHSAEARRYACGLVERMAKPSQPNRAVLVEALRSIGVVPEVLHLLASPEASLRNAARETLDDAVPRWRESAVTRDAVKTFVDQLKRGNEATRGAALEALNCIGGPAVVAGLWECWLSFDRSLYSLVRQYLERLDKDWRRAEGARRIIPDLVTAVRSGSEDRRLYATAALADLQAKEAVPPLVQVLILPSEGIRQAAEAALNAIDPSWPQTGIDDATLQGCVHAVTLPEPTATLARELLVRVQRPTTVGLLLELPVAPNAEPRKAVQATLDQTDPRWASSSAARAALAAFIAAPREPDPFWVVPVIDACRDEEEGSLLQKALRHAFDRQELEFWKAARQAFLAGQSRHSGAWLRLLDENQPPFVRELTTEKLGQPAAGQAEEARAEAAQALIRLLQDPDRFVGYAAVQSLGRGCYLQGVAALEELLRGQDPRGSDGLLRERAARALGDLGDRQVSGLLREMVIHDDWRPAQIAAAQALRRLGEHEANEFLLDLIRQGKAVFLYAYCHDLVEARSAQVSQAIRTKVALDYQAWFDGRARLDFKQLVDEVRDLFPGPGREGRPDVSVIAWTSAVWQRILDAERDPEEFLSRVRDRLGMHEACAVAEMWGIGAFWRKR
jgi:HEAT repeat protein